MLRQCPLRRCYHPSHSRSQHNAHLALSNFCPDVPFGFLNRPIIYTCRGVYLCPLVAVFGANAKTSLTVELLSTYNFNAWITCISCCLMLLIHSFSTYLHSLF